MKSRLALSVAFIAFDVRLSYHIQEAENIASIVMSAGEQSNNNTNMNGIRPTVNTRHSTCNTSESLRKENRRKDNYHGKKRIPHQK